MYVAFEGIDGSGKTTVSNRVAKRIAELGVTVTRPRPEGVLGSSIAAEVRQITRSARNLHLEARAELLLVAAREAQLFAEIAGPALERGEWVVADRSILTPLVAAAARGVPMEEARAVCLAATAGRFPDQIVVCDIDPRLARLRKRLDKIRTDAFGDKGRKSMLGEAYKERIRDGLLDLARKDPERYAVLDARLSIKQGTKLVSKRFEALFAGQKPEPLPTSDPDPVLVSPEEIRRPDLAAILDARFLDRVEAIGVDDPATASYMLIGVEGARADALRRKWADTEPAIVAYGLGGLADDAAWSLRERLADAAPAAVVRSLRGLEVRDDPRAWALRERLASRAPDPVARGLSALEGEAANALRRRLREVVPAAVVAGLRRCVSSEARALVDEMGPKFPAAWAEAMTERDDDAAWRARDEALGGAPAEVLGSLRGVESERAWTLRRRFARPAPKAVLRSFGKSTHPEAWKLRREIGGESRSVLDGIRSMDVPEAWSLREKYRDRWPNGAIASLGDVSTSERGETFVRTTLASHAADLLTLRRAAQALLRARIGDEDLDSEE